MDKKIISVIVLGFIFAAIGVGGYSMHVTWLNYRIDKRLEHHQLLIEPECPCESCQPWAMPPAPIRNPC